MRKFIEREFYNKIVKDNEILPPNIMIYKNFEIENKVENIQNL